MSKRGRPRHPDILTPREWEVLAHLRQGLSNEQIAGRLGISIDGVKYHVSEILGKLALENRSDAARWRPEEARPWWMAAGAPLLFWRRLGLGWLSPALAGGLAVVVAAGIGLLIWGLLATRGEGPQQPPTPATSAALTLDRPSPNFGSVDFVSEDEGWMLAGGGLLHTTDGGATWDEIAQVSGYDVDFADASNGWIVGSSGSIYVTDDGGHSWSTQESGTNVYLSDVFAVDAREVWAVGVGVGSHNFTFPLPTILLHTTDGGVTWQQADVPSHSWFHEMAFVGAYGWVIGKTCPPYERPSGIESRPACGGEITGAVLHTTDGGATWTFIDTDLPDSLSHLTFVDATNGWLIADCVSTKAECVSGPLQTIDGGRTWTQRAPAGYTYFRALGFRDARIGWVVAREDKVESPSTTFVLKTTDGGKTWEQEAAVPSNPNPQAFVRALRVAGETIFLTGIETALRSTGDGASMEEMRTPAVALGDLEFVDENVGFTAEGGLFLRTADGGESWEPAGFLQGYSIQLDFLDTRRGYAIAQGILKRTEDGGETWRTVYPPAEGEDSELPWGRGFDFLDNEHGWLAAAGAVFVTDDGGRSWERRRLGSTGRNLQQLRVLDAEDAWAVVETYNGNDSPRRIIRTRDGARTWEVVRELGPREASSFDAAGPEVAWYASSSCSVQPCLDALFTTSDGGLTWSESYLGNVRVRDLEFVDEAHGWISVLDCEVDPCAGGLLRTEDGGATWITVPLEKPMWGDLVFVDVARGWLQPLEPGYAGTLTTVEGRTLLYQID